MSGKVKCTCGWSWNKSDSSKKDMYICHECGRDNSNNMQNGGWLDNYGEQENYNDYKVSAPEGMIGDGFSNVGRNYSPAWGGQFQEGGEIPNAQKGKTIYVESKNDPRYTAYQDSSKLYNHTLSRFKEPWASDKKFKKTVNSNKNSKEYKEALKKYYDEDVKKSNIKPISIFFSDRKKDTYIPVFKKPQQQVIVKPTTTKQTTKPNNTSKKRKPTEKEIKEWSEPGFKLNSVTDYIDPKTKKVTQSWYGDLTRNEQAIQNNIQPIGIQNDLNIEAPIPVIRPQARMPKSYDVNSQRQTMSGPSDYYNYSDEGVDISDALRAKESADAYNQYIQEKYKEAAKSNPKAQKRLEQLMQNVELTPNYQMGGNVYPVNYVPQAQDGTELSEYDIAMRGMMKSKIGMGNAFGNPAIKRMSQAMPKTGMTPEGIGTHYMSSVDNYAVPLLQDLGEEELTLVDPDSRSREAIRFNSPEEAQYFAEHYKDVAPMSTTYKDLNSFQTGGSIPGSVGFTYARTKGIPSKGPRRNQTDVTDASAQNGQEMQYYREGLDWKPKTISREGSIIKDDRGQWAHPGEITEINSPYITMQGVPYPVLGISDTGDMQMMYPEEEYEFDGEKVTEYPMAKNGLRQEQKSLQNLNNLVNFTNYNTKQPGGWLDSL